MTPSQKFLSYNFTPIDLKLWKNILDVIYYYTKNYKKNQSRKSKKSFSKFQNSCIPLNSKTSDNVIKKYEVWLTRFLGFGNYIVIIIIIIEYSKFLNSKKLQKTPKIQNFKFIWNSKIYIYYDSYYCYYKYFFHLNAAKFWTSQWIKRKILKFHNYEQKCWDNFFNSRFANSTGWHNW